MTKNKESVLYPNAKKMCNIDQKKICFVYWGPHKVHKTWAESINAEFYSFVPFNFELLKKNGFFLHLASFLKGFIIPKADVYLLESPMMITALLPKFFLNRCSIIVINSDPFFLTIKKFKGFKRIYFDWTLKLINVVISTTDMMKDLAKNYDGLPKRVKHFVVPIYVDFNKYSRITPNTKEENFCFIGPYLNKQKGVDILINFFLSLEKRGKLYLIGVLLDDLKNLVKNEDIIVTGFVENPAEYLKLCKYYLNLSRFEPAGVNIIESMAAGFVPFVSNKCGLASEIKKINPELVINLDHDKIKDKFEILKNEMCAPKNVKKAKKISKQFSELNSVMIFKKIVYGAIKDLIG